MDEFSIISEWSGSPMKLVEHFRWRVKITRMEYAGYLTSTCTYDSPEEARNDFNKICACDEFLNYVKDSA